MTVTTSEWRSTNRAVAAPTPGSLAEVVDLILDKGLVIDAFVRVSLLGIELLTIDARIVVASVDTYLRYAEAVGRLDLEQRRGPGLPDLLDKAGPAGGVAKATKAGGVAGAARGAVGDLVERGVEKVGEAVGGNGKGGDQQSPEPERGQ